MASETTRCIVHGAFVGRSCPDCDVHAAEVDRMKAAKRQMPDYLKLIAPPVGTIWEWEPLKSHARCLLRVTEVVWNGSECLVLAVPQIRNVHYNDAPDAAPYWNELSRWVEATVLVDGEPRG